MSTVTCICRATIHRQVDQDRCNSNSLPEADKHSCRTAVVLSKDWKPGQAVHVCGRRRHPSHDVEKEETKPHPALQLQVGFEAQAGYYA